MAPVRETQHPVVMPRVQPLLLALLAFALPATAQASSVSIALPSTAPNYWEAIPYTVSGVADQDAKLYSGLGTGGETCPALHSDLYLIGQERAGFVAPVSAGSYSVPLGFAAPRADAYERAGNGPGPRTLCVYLMPASYDNRTQNPSPAALAIGTASLTLGPDCLGHSPLAAPTAKRVPGAFGDFAISGQVPWPVSMSFDNSPTWSVGPGAWSQTFSIPDEGRRQLEQGLQVLETGTLVRFAQTCKAADGAAAPAPYDNVTGFSSIALRVDGDGDLLGPHALPRPTFAGAVAVGIIQTPAPTGKHGLFKREVWVKPVGGRRPVLIAKGEQEAFSVFAVTLTPSGKKVLAALGKKAQKAKLVIETTQTRNGKTGPVRRSTMPIVKG
jgi:hypothetical protein